MQVCARRARNHEQARQSSTYKPSVLMLASRGQSSSLVDLSLALVYSALQAVRYGWILDIDLLLRRNLRLPGKTSASLRMRSARWASEEHRVVRVGKAGGGGERGAERGAAALLAQSVRFPILLPKTSFIDNWALGGASCCGSSFCSRRTTSSECVAACSDVTARGCEKV